MFPFCEPRTGYRSKAGRKHCTNTDWARKVASLLEGRHADREKVGLVLDNLNTHTMGSFYEAFEPARGRELVRRVDIRYIPRHGDWLPSAKNEFSAMRRQCLSGR